MTDHEGVDKRDFNLQDFREGSPDAFRIFFLQFYAEFVSFADLLLRDRSSAKNLTSAALFLLWAKHADFDSERNIKAFLYSSIRDSCLDYLRRLQENPGARGDIPGISYPNSLPGGILREIRDFTDRLDAGI